MDNMSVVLLWSTGYSKHFTQIRFFTDSVNTRRDLGHSDLKSDMHLIPADVEHAHITVICSLKVAQKK